MRVCSSTAQTKDECSIVSELATTTKEGACIPTCDRARCDRSGHIGHPQGPNPATLPPCHPGAEPLLDAKSPGIPSSSLVRQGPGQFRPSHQRGSSCAPLLVRISRGKGPLEMPPGVRLWLASTLHSTAKWSEVPREAPQAGGVLLLRQSLRQPRVRCGFVEPSAARLDLNRVSEKRN